MSSPNVGGYLRGPWWRYPGRDDETKTRRCFVIAWGAVVKEPSERYKDLRIIRFVIKTGRGAGRDEKHLVCVGYGERLSAVIMRALEKHDVVFCAGTWVETVTKTKKGEKPLYEMRVNFIIPFGLIGFLLDLYSTDGIQKLIDEYNNEAPDPFEQDY